jgi:hypothetical protein
MTQIISHASPEYVNAKPNGALIYSINICKYIIPNIHTDRNWITINVRKCFDHSIVFIHSNVNLEELYGHLKEYKDLVLVCSQKSTMYKMRKYGKAIYLPLSIDVDHVKKFESLKSKSTCYAGRENKMHSESLRHQDDIDYLCNYTHDGLLEAMAKYKRVYAVGLTALEAKALGCEILPYDPRFPDPSIWEVRDVKEIWKELQKKLDKIDGRKEQ